MGNSSISELFICQYTKNTEWRLNKFGIPLMAKIFAWQGLSTRENRHRNAIGQLQKTYARFSYDQNSLI